MLLPLHMAPITRIFSECRGSSEQANTEYESRITADVSEGDACIGPAGHHCVSLLFGVRPHILWALRRKHLNKVKASDATNE